MVQSDIATKINAKIKLKRLILNKYLASRMNKILLTTAKML